MSFPAVFISGDSICGGDTTTLVAASSSFMYSSKLMRIFLAVTPVALSRGEVWVILGGVSSYHPPSGWPMRAHEAAARAASAMAAAMALRPSLAAKCCGRGVVGLLVMPASMSCVVVRLCLGLGRGVVHEQELLHYVAAVAQPWYLVLPAELPLSRSQSLNRPCRASTTSGRCSVMSLKRLAS